MKHPDRIQQLTAQRMVLREETIHTELENISGRGIPGRGVIYFAALSGRVRRGGAKERRII